MVKPVQEQNFDRFVREDRAVPTSQIGVITVGNESAGDRASLQAKIRNAAGEVELGPSRSQKLQTCAENIGFYRDAERAGHGNILRPEGKGGPLLWVAKRPDPQVEEILKDKHSDTLEDIINPQPGQVDSYYVNRTGTNRLGALMSIAKERKFNGAVLSNEQLQTVADALNGALQGIQDSRTAATSTASETGRTSYGAYKVCDRKLPIARSQKATQAEVQGRAILRALNRDLGNNSQIASQSTSAPKNAPEILPETAIMSEEPPQSEPQTVPATNPQTANIPQNLTDLISTISSKYAPEAEAIITEFERAASRATSQTAQAHQADLAQSRIQAVQQAERLRALGETNFIAGEENQEHTVNISASSQHGKNVRIDFIDKNGDNKSFVYNVSKISPMGENSTLLAAQNGIKFEKTNLPSGNPHSVKITFTQPGRYIVNGKEVLVGEQPEESSTPQRTPYQEFSIGRDAKSAHIRLQGQSFQEVDLSSLQPGQSRNVENNLEVRRLENGEVRIKCFDGGQLNVVTALADGRQQSFSYAVKADPNMQRYYELQQEIAEANKQSDNADRFTALHACTAKVKLLADDLASPYKEKLTNSLKEAQTAMWDKALKEGSSEEFLSKLEGYERACNSDGTLYKLPKELITRLRRDAGLKAKPTATTYNPFTAA